MVMLVGPVGAGKTTLLYALHNSCREAKKTQCISFSEGGIDTPGEYAQIPRFYSALMVTAAKADLVLLVQAATDFRTALPPEFVSMFPCPVLGVVTKIELPGADCERAGKQLARAGVTDPIFYVSAHTGAGIAELITVISERRCKHG